MGHPDSKESDIVIDLESGGTTSEEEGSRNPSSSGSIPAKKTLGRAWSGFVGFDGSVRSADSVSIYKSELNYGRVSGNGAESLAVGLGEEGMEFVGKKMNKEKRKKLGSKKPPRPPRGPSLDAADMRMVREISQLAMMKRARVERVKALKMKMEKASSSSSINFIAMIVTFLFCFILIFQGICSGNRGSNMSFHGSPETAGDGMISIKHSMNPPTAEINGPGSGFPSSAESVSLQHAAVALQDGRKEFPGK